MDIQEIKRAYEWSLLRMANVVGVMTGYKRKDGVKTQDMSIILMVEKKVHEEELKKRDVVPPSIEDAITDVIEVGRLRALSIDKKARHRPCPMGTSGGHYLVTAGTNGELLRDRKAGKICIGTNNHVGANSNDAQIGDPYLQPAPYDGGTVQNDTIGHLLRFVPMTFALDPSECGAARLWSGIYNVPAKAFGRKTRLRPVVVEPEYNLVDASMIEVDSDDVLPSIVDIGVPKGIRKATLDMLVQKSGRTTCRTVDGEIIGVDATVGPISYGGRSAYFRDQLIIGREGFSAGGDSGSLILDKEGYAVGKLFAGSEVQNTTIANPIQTYLDLLDAELYLG
ncbi:MAG: hypothetical protein JSW05_01875 [Candidatus Thorarchaeota archaeon]|nr:MAG: hypothetical protein JSW05_01875 [Candidatus Thorarchaeota archaeon]